MANECMTLLPEKFGSLWDAKIISLNTSLRSVTFQYGVIELAPGFLFQVTGLKHILQSMVAAVCYSCPMMDFINYPNLITAVKNFKI